MTQPDSSYFCSVCNILVANNPIRVNISPDEKKCVESLATKVTVSTVPDGETSGQDMHQWHKWISITHEPPWTKDTKYD